MGKVKKIQTALISVYNKEGLDDLLRLLSDAGVKLLSTGGTQKYIESLGYKCTTVESVTGYPSILGGRVKTLHPKIFGGILARRNSKSDSREMSRYEIEPIDMVVVDLYPFTEAVDADLKEEKIIEMIDIGGVSLIRAAAKNYKDVVVLSAKEQYVIFFDMCHGNRCVGLSEDERFFLACEAFIQTSGYDSAIADWFAEEIGYDEILDDLDEDTFSDDAGEGDEFIELDDSIPQA